MNMKRIQHTAKQPTRALMCAASLWSYGDVCNAIRTQSFNPENKGHE